MLDEQAPEQDWVAAAAGDLAKDTEILRVLGRGGDGRGVVDDIVVELGRDIVEGRLQPGDDLNSVELARRFSSSRTPVREALQTLEREGLVEVPPRRRPRVAELGLTVVRDIYEVRSSLYGLVSELVVARATPADLRRLRDIQEALARSTASGDVDAYFWRNVLFRRTEGEIAANGQLLLILDRLGLRTLQLRHLSLSLPGRLDESVADHERLLRAYEQRDATLAAALTRSIVQRGLATIEANALTLEARPRP